MGKKVVTTTKFECDFCKVERSAGAIWFEFVTGKNTYITGVSHLIFCTEACAHLWLESNIRVKELSTHEFTEKFREPIYAIGNTD